MPKPDPETVDVYTKLLERVILHTRMRLRYEDPLTLEEVHDLLDAVHNIPRMITDDGGWFTEENIDLALGDYDKKWMNSKDGSIRVSLLELLHRVRAGEFR